MRLLNTRTLELDDFSARERPPYAILSHTWAAGEVLFGDMADLTKARAKAGFAKLQGACDLAASQDLDYIWIDTCCIDKSSSAELSEAINSMYEWYFRPRVCYAYLADVHGLDDFEQSRWFTRGWTLQELLAPINVAFYTHDWTYLGQHREAPLLTPLRRATRIDERILLGQGSLENTSVAKIMYWASNRVTSRLEDEAYCLMGLFGVNMPLIYGE